MLVREEQSELNETSAVEKRDKAVDFVTDSGIKVKCFYPENMPERVRQQKINRMYDILTGAYRRNENTENRK